MKRLLVLSCLTLLPHATSFATTGEVPVGGALREAPMSGLSGPSRMLSDYRGKPLLINVWASYCPPCLAEMGSLERLNKKFSKQLTTIGISIDDYPDRAKAFLAKAGTSFPHYIDHKLTLENMLGANRIPLTILVDANGKVIDKTYGAREWDSAESVKNIRQRLNLK